MRITSEKVHRRVTDETAHEFRRRSVVDQHRLGDLDDAALAHDSDAVAQTQRLHLVVRDVDGSCVHLADQFFQLGAELESQQRIQIGKRLVHQQHRRLHDNCACHRHPLALTPGELRGIAQEVRLQLQQSCRALDSAANFLGRPFLHAKAKGDVFEHGQVWEDRVALKHHRDSPLARRKLRDVPIADDDPPGIRVFETSKHAQQRGLAAATRPEQDHELSVGHRERDVGHRGGFATRVRLRDAFDADLAHLTILPHILNR